MHIQRCVMLHVLVQPSLCSMRGTNISVASPVHEILLIDNVILCTPKALNLMFPQLGVTALFAASRVDRLLVMDVLLKRGANRELAMRVCATAYFSN